MKEDMKELVSKILAILTKTLSRQHPLPSIEMRIP
jgi:hypothetical protein